LEELEAITIVRLIWAKSRQERVSSYSPTLKRGVIGCEPVLDFSSKLKDNNERLSKIRCAIQELFHELFG
jgi:hypothetical protein